MAQNSFFPDVIKYEAIQAWANTYHHECVCGMPILLKTA